MGKCEKVIMISFSFIQLAFSHKLQEDSFSSCNHMEVHFHSETPWVNYNIICNSLDGSSRVLEMSGISLLDFRLRFVSKCLRNCLSFVILKDRACTDSA